jgi:hypothetical protein
LRWKVVRQLGPRDALLPHDNREQRQQSPTRKTETVVVERRPDCPEVVDLLLRFSSSGR